MQVALHQSHHFACSFLAKEVVRSHVTLISGSGKYQGDDLIDGSSVCRERWVCLVPSGLSGALGSVGSVAWSDSCCFPSGAIPFGSPTDCCSITGRILDVLFRIRMDVL